MLVTTYRRDASPRPLVYWWLTRFKFDEERERAVLVCQQLQTGRRPIVITTGAYLVGFRGIELGILFFMNASPVAAASYVMARSMGGNSVLAANIIALTTVLSTITCTLGIVILKSYNLI